MKDKTELAETEPGAMLVHGAYGSSWSAVIRRPQGAGLAVIAAYNPLTSLADTPRTPVASWRCGEGP